MGMVLLTFLLLVVISMIGHVCVALSMARPMRSENPEGVNEAGTLPVVASDGREIEFDVRSRTGAPPEVLSVTPAMLAGFQSSRCTTLSEYLHRHHPEVARSVYVESE